jgi:hypothetical protein
MMKYLRHKTFGFVLFEKRHRHDAMARRLGMDVKDITGAGFAMVPKFVMALYPDVVIAGGESILLGIKSGADDHVDLRKEIGL